MTVTAAARPSTTGTANATTIKIDTTHLFHAVPVKVQLTASYATSREPGYPARPSMTGAKALDSAQTVASGTILTLLKPEADALVAAGAATYV